MVACVCTNGRERERVRILWLLTHNCSNTYTNLFARTHTTKINSDKSVHLLFSPWFRIKRTITTITYLVVV